MGSARLIPGLLLALACQPLPPPGPSPEPNPDACVAACDRLAEFGCEEAQSNAAGTDCVTICHEVERSGFVTIDPACIASLDSCDLDSCTYEAR